MKANITALAALCASPDFFSSTYIINVQTYHHFHVSSKNHSISTDSTYWFSTAPNISAIPSSPIEVDPGNWTFKSTAELFSSLPLSKPLLIDCPMPACAFPISGTYSELQRYLVYINLVLAVLATTTPFLRGIAQLYLATTSIASLLHFLTMFGLRDRELVDMDFVPALMYTMAGFTASIIWCLLRAPSTTTSILALWAFQALPYVFLFCVLVSIAALAVTYSIGSYPSTVLLESPAAFRLTSVCYRDSGGTVVTWSGVFNYLIRQPEELQFILPLEGDGAVGTLVFPISSKTVGIGCVAVSSACCLWYFLWRTDMILCCRGRYPAYPLKLSFLSCLPESIQCL